MFYVVFYYFGLDKHVVHIDLHCFPYQVFKHPIRKSLIDHSSILETEWHCLVAVKTSIGDEGGVLLIKFVHRDLIVSRVHVHEA